MELKTLVDGLAARPESMLELGRMAELFGVEEKELLDALSLGLQKGEIVKVQKGVYALPQRMGFVVGRLHSHPKGFAFVIPDDPEAEDVYISADNRDGAMHNDRVVARVRTGRDGRLEGTVERIVTRANQRIVGLFNRDGDGGVVIADDVRVMEPVMVDRDSARGIESGHKVVAEITRFPGNARPMEGKIVEDLGHKDDVGVDVLSIIRQFELPEAFPQNVIAEVEKTPKSVDPSEFAGREDLRDWITFTIDGADAKDLDDAVSLTRLESGWQLGVHIADVSHYVKHGTSLDKEALRRGTSVYLVDRVVPMLPRELSNGICSLNEDEDRLAFSCIMDFDETGRETNYRVVKSVIHSHKRFTYDQVTRGLEAGEAIPYLEILKEMERLCRVLRKKRMDRGGLDFDLPEPKIDLDPLGHPADIICTPRTIAHQMIEEFMLAANETVARHMKRAKLPCIYRVHEDPDPQRMDDFLEFVGRIGYPVKREPGKAIRPKDLQRLLTRVEGTPEESVVGRLMLRSLQKARYAEENLGHFGLAAKDYLHFTSPIRRYPDLFVHRALTMAAREEEKALRRMKKAAPDTADLCSIAERNAMEAEREADNMKIAEYMQAHIGEEYDGIISGVTSFGIYVQLPNTVEGLVHVSRLPGDYYVYDEKMYSMVGQRSHRVLRMGDKVRVKVTGADVARRTVDFELVENGGRSARASGESVGPRSGNRRGGRQKAAGTPAQAAEEPGGPKKGGTRGKSSAGSADGGRRRQKPAARLRDGGEHDRPRGSGKNGRASGQLFGSAARAGFESPDGQSGQGSRSQRRGRRR